jgi:hypothetical protein
VSKVFLSFLNEFEVGWSEGVLKIIEVKNWIFLIGLGPIVLRFSWISEELTDKSNRDNPVLLVIRKIQKFLKKLKGCFK